MPKESNLYRELLLGNVVSEFTFRVFLDRGFVDCGLSYFKKNNPDLDQEIFEDHNPDPVPERTFTLYRIIKIKNIM